MAGEADEVERELAEAKAVEEEDGAGGPTNVVSMFGHVRNLGRKCNAVNEGQSASENVKARTFQLLKRTMTEIQMEGAATANLVNAIQKSLSTGGCAGIPMPDSQFPRKHWDKHEKLALLNGIGIYGTNWKAILLDERFSAMLKHRSCDSLKIKWTRMKKHKANPASEAIMKAAAALNAATAEKTEKKDGIASDAASEPPPKPTDEAQESSPSDSSVPADAPAPAATPMAVDPPKTAAASSASTIPMTTASANPPVQQQPIPMPQHQMQYQGQMSPWATSSLQSPPTGMSTVSSTRPQSQYAQMCSQLPGITGQSPHGNYEQQHVLMSQQQQFHPQSLAFLQNAQSLTQQHYQYPASLCGQYQFPTASQQPTSSPISFLTDPTQTARTLHQKAYSQQSVMAQQQEPFLTDQTQRSQALQSAAISQQHALSQHPYAEQQARTQALHAVLVQQQHQQQIRATVPMQLAQQHMSQQHAMQQMLVHQQSHQQHMQNIAIQQHYSNMGVNLPAGGRSYQMNPNYQQARIVRLAMSAQQQQQQHHQQQQAIYRQGAIPARQLQSIQQAKSRQPMTMPMQARPITAVVTAPPKPAVVTAGAFSQKGPVMRPGWAPKPASVVVAAKVSPVLNRPVISPLPFASTTASSTPVSAAMPGSPTDSDGPHSSTTCSVSPPRPVDNAATSLAEDTPSPGRSPVSADHLCAAPPPTINMNSIPHDRTRIDEKSDSESIVQNAPVTVHPIRTSEYRLMPDIASPSPPPGAPVRKEPSAVDLLLGFADHY